MILKVKTHKRPEAIGPLLRYVDSDRGRARDENSFVIHHNFQADDLEGVIRAFKENDTYRARRKGGVVLQHHILSFHPDDSIGLEAAHDLAQKWLEIRNEEGLCFARAHVDNDHFHVHMLISGNKWRSPKSTMINKKVDFIDHHVALEAYQLEKYPELKHSLVKIRQRNKTKSRETEGEKHIRKREKHTRKEQIHQMVQESWAQSYQSKEFYQKLANHGLELYEYRGQLRGVLDGSKKYKFSTLGLDVSLIQALDDEKTWRKKELDRMQKQSEQDLGRKR